MNSIFSFYRIKLLAIRYFAEHGRQDLITLAAFFITFAFMPRLLSIPLIPSSFILFCFVLFIGGMRFTARIFHEIHQPASGMHYMHIPASSLEKFLLNGMFTLFVYPIACLLVYYGGTLFGNLLEPIMPTFLNYRIISLSSLMPEMYMKKVISQYVFFQSIFFLGSLVFKKHPTTKTFLSYMLFGFVVGVIQMIIIRLMWSNTDLFANIDAKSITQWIEDSLWLTYLSYLCFAVTVVFFWIVSYFKLKEKQV